jgi:hypothetical protein
MILPLRAAIGAVAAREWAVPPEAMADLRALVDEALRIADLLDGADILDANERTDGRRQWVEIGAYAHPGEVVALLDDWRREQET